MGDLQVPGRRIDWQELEGTCGGYINVLELDCGAGDTLFNNQIVHSEWILFYVNCFLIKLMENENEKHLALLPSSLKLYVRGVLWKGFLLVAIEYEFSKLSMTWT